MLIQRYVSPLLCASLVALAACDKDESLGEVDSETTSDTTETKGTGETEGDSDTDVACPADAMICPDGTAVGRSGPDCAFDPCPGDTDGGTDTEGDSGSSTGGDPPPFCKFSEYYEPASCPEKGSSLYTIEPGCYIECDPKNPKICDTEVCMPVEVNPCVCDEGEDCCAACSSAMMLCVPVSSGPTCDAIVGTMFSSVEQYECGITKDGVEMCNWSIDFQESGDYLWSYSDVGEGGTYACKDGAIALDNNPSLQISFDPDTGVLTWDGIEYVAG